MKIEKYFDKQIKDYRWRYDVTINNRRHRRGKLASERAARNAVAGLTVLAQHKLYGLREPSRPITVGELMDRAEEKCTRDVQKNLIALFRAVVDPHKAVNSLKRADMAKFLESLAARNLKAGTLGHYKTTLYSILNRAGEWFEELDEWYPPKFPRLPKANARTRVLTVDELARLFAAWERPEPYPRESAKWCGYRLELAEIAKLMLLTAARREEIEKLTAKVIDQTKRWLILKSGKVGRWHAVALNDDALALLLRRASQTPMFMELDGPVVHYTCTRVGKAAGIPFGQEVEHGWTIHDLRRTAASYIETNGISYSAVSATLGHRRQDVTSVYTPPQIKEMRRAAELLQTHWREIDGVLRTKFEICKIKIA